MTGSSLDSRVARCFNSPWKKRGELRRLAATKNNRLNSSATFNRCSKQFDESPALFASAGFFLWSAATSRRFRKALTSQRTPKKMMSSFLDTLKERIVVFDGAMGTNLQVQNLTLDDFGGLRFEGCNEHLLVTRPDAVEKVHTAFLDAGCDVIETNSFNGTPVDFSEYGIADKAY